MALAGIPDDVIESPEPGFSISLVQNGMGPGSVSHDSFVVGKPLRNARSVESGVSFAMNFRYSLHALCTSRPNMGTRC